MEGEGACARGGGRGVGGGGLFPLRGGEGIQTHNQRPLWSISAAASASARCRAVAWRHSELT